MGGEETETQCVSPVYTLDDVAQHKTADNLWLVERGRVYDVTSFAQDHPGGPDLLCMYAGRVRSPCVHIPETTERLRHDSFLRVQDVTAAMADPLEHKHSASAYEVLHEYYIGDLDTTVGLDVANVSEADPMFIDVGRPMWPQIWSNTYTKEYYVKQVHIARHTKDGKCTAPKKIQNFSFIFC